MLLIDVYSCHTWVYLLKKKSAAFAASEDFQVFVEKQTRKSIKTFQDDKGGEYKGPQVGFPHAGGGDSLSEDEQGCSPAEQLCGAQEPDCGRDDACNARSGQVLTRTLGPGNQAHCHHHQCHPVVYAQMADPSQAVLGREAGR